MEFINVGLFLTVPDIGFSKISFVDEPKRVERLFGRQPHEYFRLIANATEFRILDLVDNRDSLKDFAEFTDRRANEIRLTPLLDIRVSADPNEDYKNLFEKLVESQEKRQTPTRARARLKKALTNFKVSHLLDKPKPINLEQFDIKISAPYAYQNGSYNLIDSIKISENRAESLREVGKKAMEGSLLFKNLNLIGRTRMVIVADFSDLPVEFYHAAREHLEESDVKLYRYDEVHDLVDDILRNAGKSRLAYY